MLLVVAVVRVRQLDVVGRVLMVRALTSRLFWCDFNGSVDYRQITYLIWLLTSSSAKWTWCYLVFLVFWKHQDYSFDLLVQASLTLIALCGTWLGVVTSSYEAYKNCVRPRKAYGNSCSNRQCHKGSRRTRIPEPHNLLHMLIFLP